MTDDESNRFFVKSGYQSRLEPSYFDDNLVESGITHQPDVYPFAKFLANRLSCEYIIDIGCGQAHKLSKLYPDFQIIGIDFGKNIEFCRQEYQFGMWMECDLERDSIQIDENLLKKATIICSDTIEHLMDPTNLLNNLKRLLDYSPLCLMSTPERDLVRAENDFGPPRNPHHVREWNTKEFETLLKFYGFNLEFVGLTTNNDVDYEKKTILAIIEKNSYENISEKKTKPPKEFKIVAIMTCYNEEDILVQSINHLLNQGIGVYIIDNWSTDNSYDLALNLKDKLIGVERFPFDGPSRYYEWKKILTRVEQISYELKADWYIHHDVDEIRNSPWPNLDLRDSIYLVDKLGFSAIDHSVIIFPPTVDSFVSGSDFEVFFRYFEFGKNPGYFEQIKAWKNFGQSISLANSGGHSVEFEGRRIYPYKFLLKHYPIRTQKQGKKKVFEERKNRWSPEEKAIGWHIHYDHIKEGHSFIRDPHNFTLFDVDVFNAEYLVERLSSIGVNRKDQKERLE